jgi:hypothetical protein
LYTLDETLAYQSAFGTTTPMSVAISTGSLENLAKRKKKKKKGGGGWPVAKLPGITCRWGRVKKHSLVIEN